MEILKLKAAMEYARLLNEILVIAALTVFGVSLVRVFCRPCRRDGEEVTGRNQHG